MVNKDLRTTNFSKCSSLASVRWQVLTTFSVFQVDQTLSDAYNKQDARQAQFAKGIDNLGGQPLESKATIIVKSDVITWESNRDLCTFYRCTSPSPAITELQFDSSCQSSIQSCSCCAPSPDPDLTHDQLLTTASLLYEHAQKTQGQKAVSSKQQTPGNTTTTQFHRKQVSSSCIQPDVKARDDTKKKPSLRIDSCENFLKRSVVKLPDSPSSRSIFPLKKRPLINSSVPLDKQLNVQTTTSSSSSASITARPTSLVTTANKLKIDDSRNKEPKERHASEPTKLVDITKNGETSGM